MKSIHELRRARKQTYKPKYNFKKPPTPVAKSKKAKVCRVLPLVVAENFDEFLEIADNDTHKVVDLQASYERVKKQLLLKSNC